MGRLKRPERPDAGRQQSPAAHDEAYARLVGQVQAEAERRVSSPLDPDALRSGWEEVVKIAPEPRRGRRKVSVVSRSRDAPSSDTLQPLRRCMRCNGHILTACSQTGAKEALVPRTHTLLISDALPLQSSPHWPVPPDHIRNYWPRKDGSSFSDVTLPYRRRSPSPGPPGGFSPALREHLERNADVDQEVSDPEWDDAKRAVGDLFATEHGEELLPQPPWGLGLVHSEYIGRGNSRRNSTASWSDPRREFFLSHQSC